MIAPPELPNIASVHFGNTAERENCEAGATIMPATTHAAFPTAPPDPSVKARPDNCACKARPASNVAPPVLRTMGRLEGSC